MATYYIDFSAANDSANGTSKVTPLKRCPGMTGYTGSPTLSAGDTVVFKGGEVWIGVYPWVLSASGSSGNQITYTVDATWFTGGAWSQPTFNGQAALTSGGMIQAIAKNYFTFNNLNIINHGAAGTLTEDGASSPQAINFESCHHLIFTNLTLATYSQRTFYIHNDAGGASDSYVFDNIDASHCASLLWQGGDSTTINGWRMSNCYLHDCSSQIGKMTAGSDDGVHGDGFAHLFSGASTLAITNLEFYNNKARGDFRRSFGTAGGVTALFFLEKGTYSGNIYNNDFAVTPSDGVQIISTYCEVGGGTNGGTLIFCNNTLVNPNAFDNSIGNGFAITNGPGTYIVKNNLFSGFRYSMSVSTTSGNTYDINNNMCDNTSGQIGTSEPPDTNGHLKTYAQWQASPLFFDLNGLLGYSPTFVNSPTDNSLAPGSNGINAGQNLTNLGITPLNSDKNGNARPPTGSWWIGAFQTAGTQTTQVIKRIGRFLRLYGPAN